MASRVTGLAGGVLKNVLRLVWLALMIATPLFGFWLASSLAAYQNATQWLSLLVGLLLFPILPVGWASGSDPCSWQWAPRDTGWALPR